MPISNTNEWKVYINEAVEYGWPFTMLVQSHVRVQQSVEVVHQEEDSEGQAKVEIPAADGIADEGERIPEIVEQMEREDEEILATEAYAEDSDEEGDSVPAE